MERWKRRSVTDNDGKPMTVWHRDDLEISQNVNHGRFGWWFELERVTKAGRTYLGDAPTLRGAKTLAKEHR